MDPSTRHLVLELNKPHHFKRSCQKKGQNCRFQFPQFHPLITLITVPARIKYPNDAKLREEILTESLKIKTTITSTLENEEFMKQAVAKHRATIDTLWASYGN